ncbi:MAG: dihydroorotase [Gammaproteobacteria bacterium]|nr:dihydroorotase [Gammaproteobacteria bacterium]
MQTLSLTRPDDWHVHLRDQDVLMHTVSATAKHFARALVMPNLQPALTSVAAVLDYQQKILDQLDTNATFHPYMTIYLNTTVTTDDLALASQCPDILGAKLYPAGATTNSNEGAEDITKLYPLFELMQSYDLALQVHGEVTSGDIFEREARFIETQLAPLIANFPKLRIVLEHISTRAAVEFVTEAPEHIVATVTPQHLMFHRNHLLAGGIRPHYYCLPILKHHRDQQAIRQAVRSGNPKFFAGTDSAPHAKEQKESACGCAGVFSAPYALSFYTQVFEELDALPKLNDFLSRFGAEFYQLPRSTDTIILHRQSQTIASHWPLGDKEVIPLAAGFVLNWSVYEEN